MEEKLSGIVIGGVNFGESDKILNVFTLEQGVVSAKIRGVKKAGAKLKFASEPFCFVEFVFSKRADRRTVIGASLIDSFYPLREDILRYYAGSVVLEFLRKFQKENIVSKEMFMLSVSTLKDLAYSEKDVKSVLVGFLLKALKSVGYALRLNGCCGCGKNISGRTYFDYNCGGFFCEDCKTEQAREINLSTYQALLLNWLDKDAEEENLIKALRLLNFYIVNKTEENIKTLTELLKILNKV